MKAVRPLNAAGLSHIILPSIVVMLIGLIGAGVIVSSHAASKNKKIPPITAENTVEEGLKGVTIEQSGSKIQAQASKAKKKPKLKKPVLRIYNSATREPNRNFGYDYVVKVYGCGGSVKSFRLDFDKARSMSCPDGSRVNVWYLDTDDPIRYQEWRHRGPFALYLGDVKSIVL